MILSRGGIVVPEENIYYDDVRIEYDEDIDELTITGGVINLSWEEKTKKVAKYENKKTKNRSNDLLVDAKI